jgi:hypothetical protein
MGWRSVVILMGVAACNSVFGLDQTELIPSAADDLDQDGLLNEDDNCPTFANADQADGDNDGFGDACDFCPDDVTPFNHDEDGDLRGDDCDICPTSPDFQYDADRDGVGDPCDASGGIEQLMFFDPFATLADSWQPSSTQWAQTGDGIAPLSPVGADELGLHAPSTEIAATTWWLRIGFLSTRPWERGDQFGVRLIDAGGNIYASCMVICDATCAAKLTDPTATTSDGTFPPTPIVEMRLEHFELFHRCSFGTGTGSSFTMMTAGKWAAVTPAIVSVPHVQVMYIAAWR